MFLTAIGSFDGDAVGRTSWVPILQLAYEFG